MVTGRRAQEQIVQVRLSAEMGRQDDEGQKHAQWHAPHGFVSAAVHSNRMPQPGGCGTDRLRHLALPFAASLKRDFAGSLVEPSPIDFYSPVALHYS